MRCPAAAVGAVDRVLGAPDEELPSSADGRLEALVGLVTDALREADQQAV